MKKEKEARRLFRRNEIIGAIKLLRDANGLSLFDAKNIVEAWIEKRAKRSLG